MLLRTSQLPTEASMSWVLLSVLWLIIQAQGKYEHLEGKKSDYLTSIPKRKENDLFTHNAQFLMSFASEVQLYTYIHS